MRWLAVLLVLAACGRDRRFDDDDDEGLDGGADDGGDGDADGDGDGDGDADADTDADGDADACPPPPLDASAAQREALRIVNELRAAIGVPCVQMVSEINEAAQAHADYGVLNSGVAGCASTGHDETAGCDGYTGAAFWERMQAAGYTGGAAGEIAHFVGDPEFAIAGWVGTLWHRIPIVAPNSLDCGYGGAAGWDVMDWGTQQAADPDGVWFYPYDGATVSPFGGDESPSPPDPPAGCGGGFCQWGTFVTVLFDNTAAVTITTHELEGPDGPVVHNWEGPGGFLGNGWAMVTDPLDSGADYTVSVAGTLNGAAFSRTITFHTQ